MNTIIQPYQIESACVKLVCTDQQGTAFFITDNLLLTAFHTVIDAIQDNKQPVDIFLIGAQKVNARVIAYDADLDVCLLSIEEKNKNQLPLSLQPFAVGEDWESFGFPYVGQSENTRVKGKVHSIKHGQRNSMELSVESMDKDIDYSGLSGAPVMTNGKVSGIVLQQSDNLLIAVSTEMLEPFFKEKGIEFEEASNEQDVPKELEGNTIPNQTVFTQIDTSLQSRDNWLLIHGSPGSGKTTIAASFLPASEHITIIGRYFTKVPNDTLPISLKTSPAYFLKWMENRISVKLTGDLLPQGENDWTQRLKKLSELLIELSAYLASINKTGLLIIDGLDEVNELGDFLGIFPTELPYNIKVVLSCTSKDILPATIKTLINADQEILVTPLDFSACAQFIAKQTATKEIPYAIIEKIAIRSEGHPLYLRYLINYLNTQEIVTEEGKMEQWLADIPVIGGDITKYYESIWNRIHDIPDKLWITIILSQLRQPIEKNELIKTLPEPYRLSFYANYQSIVFLLNEKETVEMYHGSFKIFITSKVPGNIITANDHIVSYCAHDPTQVYAVNNIIYHQSLSSHPEKSIEQCNQEWADTCAMNNVSPDLVTSDIRRIVNLSIDLAQTTSLIRLLLLLHRIEFRYDSVFADNASLIAQAMIANDKFDAALRYLVRDNSLQVNFKDANHFLQAFYENDAVAEAKVLLTAIETRFIKSIDEVSSKQAEVSTDLFVMMLNASTLAMNANFRIGLMKNLGLMRGLLGMKDQANKTGDTDMEEALDFVRKYGAAFNYAYTIRRFGIYKTFEEIAETTKIPLTEEWTTIMAMAAALFKEQEDYNTVKLEKGELFNRLIADIERAIGSLGRQQTPEALEKLVLALIDESKNPDLVSELIEEYLPKIEKTVLRKPNGVDLNAQHLRSTFFISKLRGYIDSQNNFPVVTSYSQTSVSWEKYVDDLFTGIGYCDGRLSRIRSENKLADAPAVIAQIIAYSKKIDFKLKDRSGWERAYHLPEFIFPFLYYHLTRILVAEDKTALSSFLSQVKNNSVFQLGLFSEGFRDSLFEVIKQLIHAGYDAAAINEITGIWEKHTLTGIQNRWERTPELLKIIEIYGLVGNIEKSSFIFKEMLKTSMGPSWYKEAQLMLLNTVLTLKPPDEFPSAYVKEFAGLLDVASSEMSFEEYVRGEKEDLIESMIHLGSPQKAIEYFSKELVPEPAIIISNAESNSFDATGVGEGYNLGANNLNVYHGALRLLRNFKQLDGHVRKALCDVFIAGPETGDFIDSFAKQQAIAANDLEKSSNPHLPEQLKSLAAQIVSEDFKEDRQRYLNNLGKELSDANTKSMKGYLLSLGVTWGISESDSKEQVVESKEEPKDALEIFNEKCKERQHYSASALIQEGLDAFLSTRISIWMVNYSSASREARKNVKGLFGNDTTLIQQLKKHINNYDTETWDIANQVIWFLEDYLSVEQLNQIYAIISEHFSLLIRPVPADFEKYKWLDEKSSVKDENILVIGFLIWLLNFPVKAISQKAHDSLLRLAMYQPAMLIPILFGEALREIPLVSTEESALLLKEIAATDPNLIIDAVGKDAGLTARLENIAHFSIRQSLFEMSISLNQKGFTIFYEKISKSIPSTVILVGDVALEEDWLYPVEDEIDELNRLQILDRRFCEEFLQKANQYFGRIDKKKYHVLDKYIIRSFSITNSYLYQYEYLLRYALNIAVTRRVDKKNVDEVYNILKLK